MNRIDRECATKRPAPRNHHLFIALILNLLEFLENPLLILHDFHNPKINPHKLLRIRIQLLGLLHKFHFRIHQREKLLCVLLHRPIAWQLTVIRHSHLIQLTGQ